MDEQPVGEPQVEVRNLSVHFVLAKRPIWLFSRREPVVLRAVDGVDLAIGRGEAVGLVGESGCGKSTLARCLAGIETPTSGEIRLGKRPFEATRRGAEARRVQMVFQDPYSSLNPRMTVRQTLAELLRVHRMVSADGVEKRCLELLRLVGLSPQSLQAFPRQLSGGQRQRVAIARALAVEPDLLVADEPTSALDVSVQAAVLNLLSELRERLDLTLLLISHNMAVVRHVCDRVAVMYLGRIVEEGMIEEVFFRPAHPYTQALLRAVPRLAARPSAPAEAALGDLPSAVELPEGCRFHPRCPIAQEICSNLDPKLELGPDSVSHAAACHFAWTAHGGGRRRPHVVNDNSGQGAS